MTSQGRYLTVNGGGRSGRARPRSPAPGLARSSVTANLPLCVEPMPEEIMNADSAASARRNSTAATSTVGLRNRPVPDLVEPSSLDVLVGLLVQEVPDRLVDGWHHRTSPRRESVRLAPVVSGS